MPERFQVRKADNNDLEMICEIERISFPNDPYPSILIDKLIQDRQSIFLVLTDRDGKIRGYCIAKANNQEAHLISLAVLPTHRRSGVATVLLKALFSTLINKNIREVNLEVRTDNDVAINLYSEHGFVVETTVDQYYSDGSAALRMKRLIQ